MRRMRLLAGILGVALMLLLCSCSLFAPERYVCDTDKVESVQIVKLDKFVKEEYRCEYTVLSEIEDYTAFIELLNNLKRSVNWGEPSVLGIGCVVIRIDYLNGDYDYLYPNAQIFHRSGLNHYGYFFFDEEQFNALISDYWTE